MMQEPIPTPVTLVIEEGDPDYNNPTKVAAKLNAATPDAFSLFWAYTVKPQSRIRWGDGTPALPSTQQVVGFSAVNKAAAIVGRQRYMEGTVELRVVDANGYRIQPVQRFSAASLRKAGAGEADTDAQQDITYDRQIARPLPEMGPDIGWGNRLELHFKKLTAGEPTVNDVYFTIPATRYV